MQNLKLYTGYFKTSTNPGEEEFKRFLESFVEFNEYYQNHVPTYRYAFLQELYNKDNLHGKLYNNILKNICEYFGIKVMFKDYLNAENSPIRGIQLIGDELRIQIAHHVLITLTGLIKDFLKTNSGRDYLKDRRRTKKYSSLIINKELKNITNTMQSLLVTDFKYAQRLENFVLSHFKLDFKKYNTDMEQPYYHAVTNKYYNRRVLT